MKVFLRGLIGSIIVVAFVIAIVLALPALLFCFACFYAFKVLAHLHVHAAKRKVKAVIKNGRT